MNHRILDFSRTGVRLRVKYRQLTVFQGEFSIATVPLEEIAVVLLSHPQITLSQGVLEGLSNAGALTVICDRKSLPIGLCYPLVGHHLQSNRMRNQAITSKPTLKRLWRQIVRNKIDSQASVLLHLFQDDCGLKELSKSVRSGDADNREGLAARRYWSKLFGSNGFRRQPSGDDPINIALNYGYGVLRAIIARAISAAGLHPSLGIFHHNKYNPYCLADDLMEPFRPVTDYCVYRLNSENHLFDGLNSVVKECIINQLTKRYEMGDFQESIFETAAKIAESLARVYEEKQTELLLPTRIPLGPVKLPSSLMPYRTDPIANISVENAPF